MIFHLTEDQRQWVQDSGFQAILDFNLELLPAKLAYNVLQVFDHNTMSIKIVNGNININHDDVFDCLGLPATGNSIKLGTHDKYRERLNNWYAQFPNDKITTSQVVEQVKGAGVNQNFKLNFLIVLSNVLMRTSTHSYVERELLRFDDDLDKCSHYNWAEYLTQNLVYATQVWNRTVSVFYSGSLLFLTVRKLVYISVIIFSFLLNCLTKYIIWQLFYVDRVRHMGVELVERHSPSYIGWNEVKLKFRQQREVIEGRFGTGCILPPLKDILSKDTGSAKSQPSPKVMT